MGYCSYSNSTLNFPQINPTSPRRPPPSHLPPTPTTAPPLHLLPTPPPLSPRRRRRPFALVRSSFPPRQCLCPCPNHHHQPRRLVPILPSPLLPLFGDPLRPSLSLSNVALIFRLRPPLSFAFDHHHHPPSPPPLLSSVPPSLIDPFPDPDHRLSSLRRRRLPLATSPLSTAHHYHAFSKLSTAPLSSLHCLPFAASNPHAITRLRAPPLPTTSPPTSALSFPQNPLTIPTFHSATASSSPPPPPPSTPPSPPADCSLANSPYHAYHMFDKMCQQ